MKRVVIFFIAGLIAGGIMGGFLSHYLADTRADAENGGADCVQAFERLEWLTEENERFEKENLDLETELSALRLATPPPQEETRVEAIPNRVYFDKVHSIISGARHTVFVIMYSMDYYPDYPYGHQSRLLSDLIAAKKRGVDVRVLLEISDWNENLTDQNRTTADYLKKNGVEVRFDTLDTTTHSKLLVVDSRIVVVGSVNWTYSAIDENNEASVVVYSNAIAIRFGKYFQELWQNGAM
jgi:phosphatidylserine/phosphatidylglycerophosphate/cardiolipin synthase-like enzyme